MIGGCALNHGSEKGPCAWERSVRGCGTSVHSGCEWVMTFVVGVVLGFVCVGMVGGHAGVVRMSWDGSGEGIL